LDGSNLISQNVSNDYLNILDMPIKIARDHNKNLNVLNNMTVEINQNCHANENLNQNKEVAEPTSNTW